MNIAIAGATGAVGHELIKLLVQRNFPVTNVKLLASARSAGSKLQFGQQMVEVEELTHNSFENVDIAFFSCGGDRSKEFAPSAANSGAIVIDNSSAFRMDKDIPLIVPEVNPEDLKSDSKIIANPNCSTIQMVVALKPIHDLSPIKRVIVSTYQAVSGTGAKAVEELENQVKQYVNGEPIESSVYPVQIAFNALPHIDVFQENGYTKEEMKMVNETQKIMHDSNMKVSATCVRVPVFRAHSESINIETESKITVEQAKKAFSEAPGVVVKDAPEAGGYPVPVDATETFDTFVGRIREDISVENGLSFWCVADQLYKGAALNAIQIAELIRK